MKYKQTGNGRRNPATEARAARFAGGFVRLDRAGRASIAALAGGLLAAACGAVPGRAGTQGLSAQGRWNTRP